MLDLLTVGPKFTRPACCAAAAAIGRYLLPAPALSNKPAGRRCCCRSTGQTDGRADRRTLDRLLHGLRNKESVGRDDRLIIELSFDLSENVYAMPINRLSARVPRRNRRRGRGERRIAREASRPCDCADTGGVRITDGRTPIRDN